VGIAQARAKLLLFGEHAAVYGHPAVGCTLPWCLQAAHQPGLRWDLPGLGPHETAVRTLLERLGALAGEEGLPTPIPGRLTITTTVPLASGFGSSGALCAALVTLFWPDLPLTERDRLAWQAEGLFHGTPSGIDTALALRQGWWALDTSTKPVAATALPDPGLVLVVGALVREANTKALVGDLARRRAEGDPLVLKTLADLGTLSSQAVRALTQNRPAEIPELATRARKGLGALGLESQAMTRVLDGALSQTGALAGKLSGAGGGGAFFLIYPNQSRAQSALAILEALVDRGLWVQTPTVIASGTGEI